MGDAADDTFDAYIDSLFNYDGKPDYQFDNVDCYQWKDAKGKIWNMHQMSTEHITNAMKFADPKKKEELFQTLKDRCGIEENEKRMDSGLFSHGSMGRLRFR